MLMPQPHQASGLRARTSLWFSLVLRGPGLFPHTFHNRKGNKRFRRGHEAKRKFVADWVFVGKRRREIVKYGAF